VLVYHFAESGAPLTIPRARATIRKARSRRPTRSSAPVCASAASSPSRFPRRLARLDRRRVADLVGLDQAGRVASRTRSFSAAATAPRTSWSARTTAFPLSTVNGTRSRRARPSRPTPGIIWRWSPTARRSRFISTARLTPPERPAARAQHPALIGGDTPDANRGDRVHRRNGRAGNFQSRATGRLDQVRGDEPGRRFGSKLLTVAQDERRRRAGSAPASVSSASSSSRSPSTAGWSSASSGSCRGQLVRDDHQVFLCQPVQKGNKLFLKEWRHVASDLTVSITATPDKGQEHGRRAGRKSSG
jgi:hypothetical protein